MNLKVYGENGITIKIALKLLAQRDGYSKFMKCIGKRYEELYGESIASALTISDKDLVLLFPTFGKGGRNKIMDETGFGEPDMLIATDLAILLFEYETKAFNELLRYSVKMKNYSCNSLPYQLCRFYQLGELLTQLDNKCVLDSDRRSVGAYHYFPNNMHKYYFNMPGDHDRHSFASEIRKLLSKKAFYVISVTNDASIKNAVSGLNQMLDVVGERYQKRRFIPLTYRDLQISNVFGASLQIYCKSGRQGFQAIRIRGQS